MRALQNWRTRGGKDPESRGPRYVGRTRAVRYRRRDLIAWAEANLVEHSSQQEARNRMLSEELLPPQPAPDRLRHQPAGRRLDLIRCRAGPSEG